MTFAEMQAAVLDQRFGASRADAIKRKINVSIAGIWAADDFAFKRRPAVSIAVTPYNTDGLYTVTCTEVIEEILGCYDENGDPLTFLDPDKFEDAYEYGTDEGSPEAFTVYGTDGNLQIRFGPAPDVAKSFRLPYAAGPPTLTADSDDLADFGWPSRHHEIVVVDARISLLRDENDGTWRELEPERTRLLNAMKDALLTESGGETREYGADRLGYERVT